MHDGSMHDEEGTDPSPDRDGLDRGLQTRFEAVTRTPAPDTWKRVMAEAESGSVATTGDVSRSGPSRRVLTAASAAAVIAIGWFGLAGLPGGDDDNTTVAVDEPALSTTAPPERSDPTQSVPGQPATSDDGPGPGAATDDEWCQSDGLAPTEADPAAQKYQPSASPQELTGEALYVLRGQIVDVSQLAGWAGRLTVKVRDVVDGQRQGVRPPSMIDTSTTARLGGLEGADFVAFMVDGDAGTIVHPEGLWVACGITVPALPGSLTPEGAGWQDFLDGEGTLEDLWRSVLFPDGELRKPLGAPVVLDDGTAVYDIQPVSGGRYRLTIPEALIDDQMEVIHRPEPDHLTIEGSATSMVLAPGSCPNEDATQQTASPIFACDRNHDVALRLTTSISLSSEERSRIEMRPIWLSPAGPDRIAHRIPRFATCYDCTPWGPLLFTDRNVVVNRLGTDTVAAVDLNTLEELWVTDFGGAEIELHSGVSFLFVDVADGPFVALDPRTGSEAWRINRGPGERDVRFTGYSSSILLRSSTGSTGDGTDAEGRPILRRVDERSGEILWKAEGRPGTDWQWADPVVADGNVLLVDLPSPDSVEVPRGTIQVFNVATGEPGWSVVLDNGPRLYDTNLIQQFEFEQGPAVLVRSVEGDVLRVDPATGEVLWRSTVPLGRFTGTDYGPDGTLGVDLATPQGHVVLDPENGDVLTDPGDLDAEPFVCPVTKPPDPAFVPPDDWPSTPADEDFAWIGTDQLWTVVDLDGRGQRKSVWWSANFQGGAVEGQPEIEVVFQRLEGDVFRGLGAGATVVNPSPGTNAFTGQDGWFMINGLEPHEDGCWRATATYKGAQLSYVYQVGPGSG